MRIISYEFETKREPYWHVNKIEFNQGTNLIVGDTGTGKTRLLNTLFNLGTFAVNKQVAILSGWWNIVFEQNSKLYRWNIEIAEGTDDENIITFENLWEVESSGKELSIIQRDKNTFKFKGQDLPKLPFDQTSILLLSEEQEIRPIYKGFAGMIRRRFSQDELENVSKYQAMSNNLAIHFKKNKDIDSLFHIDVKLNLRLFLMMQYFSNIFEMLKKAYIETYPFITEIEFLDLGILHKEVGTAGQIPVFCIKEKGIKGWVELGQLSSGMQKVLLILTDILLIPDEGIYLVDEYENSLGINSINFLPDIILDIDKHCQFIITSHHPYIINKFPISNWIVIHRNGAEVISKSGRELTERYGKSKHQAFINLVNDPFFREGVE